MLDIAKEWDGDWIGWILILSFVYMATEVDSKISLEVFSGSAGHGFFKNIIHL
jgi:hypothetical protein